MQTLIQIICTKQSKSLRRVIETDSTLEEYYLFVDSHKKHNRPNGWLKIKMKGENGALNIEWDNDTKILSARAITRNNTTPATLIANFLHYLLAEHTVAIKSVNIIPI